MRKRWVWLVGATMLGSAGCSGAPAVGARSPAASELKLERVLPLDQHELAEAVNVAGAFAGAYETWRYDESSTAYLGRLKRYCTADLLSLLAKSASTQGLLVARVMVHEVAVGHANVRALQSVGRRALMVTVRVDQVVTTSTRRTYVHDYAVWLLRSDVWRVSDIEPVDDAEADDLWIAD
ncbi:hypothetical protein [Actinomadura rayongensis]|uniref:Nuclear transport factor 2 family protein n=1 Tax=Actinomadura rayongensis TaxID=1429076 RepID=A0A6I4W4L8_9ACTN|nr:hypothetical protein [Actinomadura rayongensis]MXQ65629.1 hypothetical protein [Actinomadura rayongensis]